jgi:hypothetical protein
LKNLQYIYNSNYSNIINISCGRVQRI